MNQNLIDAQPILVRLTSNLVTMSKSLKNKIDRLRKFIAALFLKINRETVKKGYLKISPDSAKRGKILYFIDKNSSKYFIFTYSGKI
jgi:hypothetical protein